MTAPSCRNVHATAPGLSIAAKADVLRPTELTINRKGRSISAGVLLTTTERSLNEQSHVGQALRQSTARPDDLQAQVE